MSRKKKQKLLEKKSKPTIIYVVLAVLFIAALFIYLSATPEKPQEKLPLLFSWDSIPGEGNTKLINFLEKLEEVKWVRNATIEKTADRVITISEGTNSFSLSLDEKKSNVLLKTDTQKTYEFIVKRENGKLNIYPKYTILTGKPSTYEPGKVKIIEFLKFNCGHCFSLNPQLPALKKKYGDNLSITYKPMLWRSMPQDQAFRKSIEAYILAERMEKGEEMKDALFKALFVDKKDLSSELVLGDIAKSAGLGEDFSAALKRGDAKDEAEANIRLAESFQVDETPTIIINGNLKVTPAMTNEDMDAMAGNLDTIVASLLG